MDGISRRDLLRGGVALGATVAGAGVLGACSSSESSTQPTGGGGTGGPGQPSGASSRVGGKPKSGGALKVAASGGGAQDTLDPNLAFDDPAIIRDNNLYETLTKLDLDYKLQNVLAESFEPSKKGAVWTVRVRKDVTFHNGKDFTADDVLASFQRVFSKKSPSTNAALLSWLNLKESKKLDKHTVRFVLDHPVGPFSNLISQVAMIPVDFDPKTGIGTGPFKLDSFKPGNRSVFSRYGDYWRRPAYLDQLITIDFPDPTAGVNALLGGQVDVLSSVPISQTRTVKSGGANLLLGDKGRPLLFDMRQDRAPFNDVRVRQAFRLIVDRKQMVEQAVDGFGAVGNDMYSPWDPAYPSDIPQRHQDIDKAKSLLKQAGHDGLSVELPTAPIVSGMTEMCLVFKQQAKAAGVTVNVRQTDPGTFESKYFGQAPFIPDFLANLPYLHLSGLYQLPGAPFNATHSKDPQYLALFKQALRELDDSKRIGIEAQMYQMQYDHGTYILPVHATTVDAYSNNVGGFVNHAKVTMPLDNAYFYNVFLK